MMKKSYIIVNAKQGTASFRHQGNGSYRWREYKMTSSSQDRLSAVVNAWGERGWVMVLWNLPIIVVVVTNG